ncbi:hypothetical protein [Methanobrevibacter sp.]|uniref:hypothetical protein n=1 Tax=Methanobrevibacter sp. TaxID=66852 RepID=UPI00386CE9CF
MYSIRAKTLTSNITIISCEYFQMKYSKLKAGEELQLHRSNPEDIEFVENILS